MAQQIVIGQTYVVRTYRRGRKFLPLSIDRTTGRVSGIFLDGGHDNGAGITNNVNANIRRTALKRDSIGAELRGR